MTKFLAKICQFKFLVMTEKKKVHKFSSNKTFQILAYFLYKKCNPYPLKKVTPSFTWTITKVQILSTVFKRN